ncbi:MAG TPA: hypothetical protein VFZ66_30000 [Herpetosiphonaceae bacterium]
MSPKKAQKPAPPPDMLAPIPGPPIMDRRAMEKMMAQVSRALSEQEFESIDEANAFLQELMTSGRLDQPSPPETPLEEAQEVMYQAWNAPSKRQRVELAKRALQISPDCADAYVLLAEESTRSVRKAKDLYEQGVQAAERALGPEVFEQGAGHFWGMIETRPYMRARAGLAQTLWALGKRQEAIEHFTDLLRLNPGDNQGLRYLLASCLFETGMDEALGELLDRYKEDESAAWLYTRAIWLFRREGPGRKANAALRKAFRQNPHVPLYLTGAKEPPDSLPPFIGYGDESEAIEYLIEGLVHWLSTPGALEWLAQTFAKQR